MSLSNNTDTLDEIYRVIQNLPNAGSGSGGGGAYNVRSMSLADGTQKIVITDAGEGSENECTHYVEGGEVVTFVFDGKNYAISIVRNNDVVPQPPIDPEIRSDQQMLGWEDEEGNLISFPFDPSGDVILYPRIMDIVGNDLYARYIKWENVKWHYRDLTTGEISGTTNTQSYILEMYAYDKNGNDLTLSATIDGDPKLIDKKASGYSDIAYVSRDQILDLGGIYSLGKIAIYMYHFTNREYFYKMSVSMDGEHWQYVWNEDGTVGWHCNEMGDKPNQVYLNNFYEGE